jgi:two-component system cell cycle sensor histidine kinase PleC
MPKGQQQQRFNRTSMALVTATRAHDHDRDEARHELNMFTLTFKDKKVEHRYVRDNMSKELPLMRLSLFFAAVLYGAFGILDYYMMPGDYGPAWLIRYGIVCPILLTAFASTYGSIYYFRFSQILLSLCMAICGFGIIAMIAISPPPTNDTYYAGLIMVVFFGAVLVRLRFINASMVSLSLIVSYEIVAIYINPIPLKALVANNAFLVMASLTGHFGSYVQEFFIRRNWASTQMLMRGRELLAESQAANHAKREFLAIVSHELRTPLNAIIGFSEFLKMEMFGPLGSERYKSYAKDIYDSGNHLLEIINDILDLSRAEANKLQLTEEDIPLQSILDSNLRMFRKTAASEGVRLKLISGPMPVLHVDERLMMQVVTNLLSNAIKFTEKGGEIIVSVNATDAGSCKITVSDTGIGIAEQDIPKIIEPFVQVESADTRHHDGLGLGLPLVKRITELHNGQLEITSDLGLGTVVTVLLPAERVVHWDMADQPELAAASG